MMRVEPCEECQSINIVMNSGMATREDKRKQPETEGWVHKTTEKEVGFDLNWARETYMEAKMNFVEASTSQSQEKQVGKSEI